MKTTVSIPAQLFQHAEAFAKAQGVSRSQLYARALEEYLERHEESGITARLNAIYSREDSALSPELSELGFEAIRRTER